MKIIMTLSSLILLLCIPAMGFTAEIYNTAYIDGKAPIIIDGEISDWEWITVVPVSIDKMRIFGSSESPEIEKNFSATFQCLMDESNLYATFIVSDDRLVFGNAKNGKPFWDDAVEIVLFGNQAISPTGRPDVAKIWVSANSQGKTKLEGREPQSTNPNYPYMSRVWGIQAALNQNEKGYTVEILVPLKVLEEWAQWEKDQPLRLNLRVYDDNSEQEEIYLEWADNAYISPDKSNNEINFVENISQQNNETIPQENELNTSSEIEIVLNEPDQIGNSDDTVIQELSIDLAVAIALEKSKLFNEAIEELEKILEVSPKNDIQNKAKLALARNCFFINDFNRSRQLCEELLNSEINSKTDLDTRMILLSIERKMNKNKRSINITGD